MKATLIRADDAPRFGQDGTAITGYASPSRGSEHVASWRIRLEPGAGSPLHDLTHGESFVVIVGRGVFDVDGERHEVGPGDAISVPPDTTFRLANEGDEPFETFACMVAGGKARVAGGDAFVPPWAA
jgi:quercetin dioxygenase-like cupin family protein